MADRPTPYIEEIGEEEAHSSRADAIWKELQADEDSLMMGNVSVFTPIIDEEIITAPAPIPSPIRRSALGKRSSPSWVDAMWQELKREDDEASASRNAKRRSEREDNRSKRQRPSVEEAAEALMSLNIRSPPCTTIAAWCPPLPAPRLVRHARRQASRRRLIYDRRRSNAPTPMPFAKVQMPLSPVPADDPRRQWNCRRDAQPTSPLEGLEGMHVFG
jgi:hypothetical protein